MLRRATLAAVVLLLAASACAAPPPRSDAEGPAAAAGLQTLLDEAVSDGIPGISAAVATRDGVVWAGVAGRADLQAGEPISPDMLFGIGSITKVFVAVVIIQLAQEGRLDLDATAADVLGGTVEGIPNARTATIAQLLNHTSGIPSWEDQPEWIREGRGDRSDVDRHWDGPATLSYISGHMPLAPPERRVQLRQHEFHPAGDDHRKGDGQGRRG